jgi:hypothetical protein
MEEVISAEPLKFNNHDRDCQAAGSMAIFLDGVANLDCFPGFVPMIRTILRFLSGSMVELKIKELARGNRKGDFGNNLGTTSRSMGTFRAYRGDQGLGKSIVYVKAEASHGGSRRFESCCAHHKINNLATLAEVV